MTGARAAIEGAGRVGVWVAIVAVDEAAGHSPLALDQDHSVTGLATHDTSVADLSGRVPVDGDVAGLHLRHERIVIVAKNCVHLSPRDAVPATAKHVAVAITRLPAVRQVDGIALKLTTGKQ